jgi:hypothetical protein
MKIRRIDDFYSLVERAAWQDRAAEMAAEVAQEADRTGLTCTADRMWRLVRRCRIRAIQLRAQDGGVPDWSNRAEVPKRT